MIKECNFAYLTAEPHGSQKWRRSGSYAWYTVLRKDGLCGFTGYAFDSECGSLISRIPGLESLLTG